jgi:hypothetical protein
MMTKVCVPLEKGDEITVELMNKWAERKVPWGFKEVDDKDWRPPFLKE